MRTQKNFILLFATLSVLSLTACDSGTLPSSSVLASGSQPVPVFTPPPTTTPPTSSRTWQTDALVFNGTGAWTGEAQSLESILIQHGMTYQEVNSAELDAMSVDDMAKFGAIVWPGGDGNAEGNGFSQQTHANIRSAVRDRGVGFVGFCAGAWLAVAPASLIAGSSAYIGIVDGPILAYYTPANQSNGAAMTVQNFADGSTHDIIWIGGPQTPNTGVVAKYSTGEPAISELQAGTGLVVISGGHPAAPAGSAESYGLTDTDGPDFDVAFELMNAAIKQQPLPTF